MKVIEPRRLPKKSTNKNLIWFYSHKNQKHMFCESYLERDVYLTFEFLRCIESYEVQDMRVQFDLDGRRSIYTPDAKVKLHGDVHSKGVIVEVKRFEELVKPKVYKKLRQARREFLSAGYGFVICKDIDFQVEPRLGNLRLLYRNRNSLPSQNTQALVRSKVGGNVDMTLGELNRLIKAQGEIFSNAYAMAAHGSLKVNLNEPISPKSVVIKGELQ